MTTVTLSSEDQAILKVMMPRWKAEAKKGYSFLIPRDLDAYDKEVQGRLIRHVLEMRGVSGQKATELLADLERRNAAPMMVRSKWLESQATLLKHRMAIYGLFPYHPSDYEEELPLIFRSFALPGFDAKRQSALLPYSRAMDDERPWRTLSVAYLQRRSRSWQLVWTFDIHEGHSSWFLR